ncbi:MAG TPA: TolC family protein [Terriglobales bacterium]|nr:TolC family protein [Terriglobales bacterium]
MTIRFLTLLLVIPLITASIAGAEVLSRAQAIAVALQANPEVIKAREQMRYLDGRVLEEKSNALPEISATGTSFRYTDPSFLNSAGLSKMPAEFLTALKPVPQNTFEGVVSVRQTLYSFKLGKAIQAAKTARLLGGADLERVRQQIALETAQAYNALLYSMEQDRVQRNALEQRRKHLEMTRNRRQAGVATELEVLRAEVAAENQRAAVTQAEGGVDLARAQLNALMLRAMDAPITPSDSLTYTPKDYSLEDILGEAMANRPDLQVAQFTEDVRSQLVGVTKASSKPALEFIGNYGRSTRLVSNLFDPDYSKWSAAMNLKIPIFDGRRVKGQVQQAEAELGKTRQDRIALQNQIRLQAMDALVKLNVSARLITAAQLNVTQAKKALDMTQANYNYGAATVLDVTDAQNAVVQAETTLAQALQQHADAKAMVNYVMGRNPAGSSEEK